MKNIIRMATFLLVIAITGTAANAQDDVFKASNAVLLQVNGNTRTENVLNGVIIDLPYNSDLLTVKFNFPSDSINYKTADNTAYSTQGLLFDLKIKVDQWHVQEYVTSSKTFVTHGQLTLNGITKPILVEYLPLPAVTGQEGDFNLSLVSQFSPGDFNLEDQYANSNYTIKIGNMPINHL